MKASDEEAKAFEFLADAGASFSSDADYFEQLASCEAENGCLTGLAGNRTVSANLHLVGQAFRVAAEDLSQKRTAHEEKLRLLNAAAEELPTLLITGQIAEVQREMNQLRENLNAALRFDPRSILS